MLGLGYRREMQDWDMSQVKADFFEVAPENWVRRDLTPLLRLKEAGFPIYFHGVSLNLGGTSEFDRGFLGEVRRLITELDVRCYSDHLAASGDAHQLYDLFPIPFTEGEARRVADRIKQVQDILGMQIAVENSTWYTNKGDINEADFVTRVLEMADCGLLLDVNNLAVNYKNHGLISPEQFVSLIDPSRVRCLHVAGHEFDSRFGMFLDTHSQPVEAATRTLATWLSDDFDLPVLLEWDNDIPDRHTINRELECLRISMTTHAA